MSAMPKPPRTDGEDHEKAAVALQRWIWSGLAAGWNPAASGEASGRWTLEDNQEAMPRGWMISNPPNSEHLDLFSLRRGQSANDIMKTLIKGAPVDPLCAKAVAVLSAQRLKHTHINFAFARENKK